MDCLQRQEPAALVKSLVAVAAFSISILAICSAAVIRYSATICIKITIERFNNKRIPKVTAIAAVMVKRVGQ